MWIMVIYVLVVAISESVVVAIGLALDRVYPALSLPISLSLFFASVGSHCAADRPKAREERKAQSTPPSSLST
jgi:hypothetical protein